MNKVGIFSGAFDPVHDGHIAFALSAAEAGGLDMVIFLPERQPRAKTNITDFEHRAEMLRLAAKPYGKLDVLELPDTQFTVPDTLPKLQNQFAGAQLFILLGSDAARNLPAWPQIDELMRQTKIIVGLRRDDSEADLRQLIGKYSARITFIPSPHAHAAASQIREGGAQAAVNPKVLAYIRRQKLYTNSTSANNTKKAAK